jgi:dihydrolipoamide dehydrogenase
MNGGVGMLMKKNKVDVIWGEAKDQGRRDQGVQAVQEADGAGRRKGAPKGTLGEGTYQAKHIIVATGARPRVLPGIEPDGKLIWTYFEAMVPPKCRNR